MQPCSMLPSMSLIVCSTFSNFMMCSYKNTSIMSLSAQQVDPQIQHMIKFIQEEAREKAEEIEAKTEEEVSIEHARIVTEQRQRIQQQYERKFKQVDTKKKIEYSNKLNEARIAVLKTQAEHLKKVIDAAREQLTTITKDKKQYKSLLQDLITQGLCSLLDTEVVLSCRAGDKELVKEVLAKSKAEFKEKSGLEVEVTVAAEPLPDTCQGGVVLSVNEGRIRVANTLDKRLDQIVEKSMPSIKEKLFGAAESRKFFD
eukprot:m.88390 g.88390  ORF g.88390 m.88390 type:complete len:257 (-) comp12857_c0_seq1:210-980(-)